MVGLVFLVVMFIVEGLAVIGMLNEQGVCRRYIVKQELLFSVLYWVLAGYSYIKIY